MGWSIDVAPWRFSDRSQDLKAENILFVERGAGIVSYFPREESSEMARNVVINQSIWGYHRFLSKNENKNELSKLKKKLIILFLRTKPTRELAILSF